MTKVLVSIVNWNNSAATNACLASIGRLPKNRQPDLLVIDNGSKDELSIPLDIKKTLRSLSTEKNEQNLGFAGGHNIGIRKAHASGYDYIILLNNDSELIDHSLFSELTEALASVPKALGANPTILSSVGPNIIWYGGGKLSLKTSYASHLQVGAQAESAAGVRRVSLLTGGCLAIALKRAPLEQLLLNENYFVYWEDTDWCARSLKAGFELLYVPKVRLLHHVSSSLGVQSPAYIYYNIRNHFLFARRNINPIYWPLCWLRIAAIVFKYEIVIMTRYQNNKLACLRALSWGWLDGLLGVTGKLRRHL